MERFSFGDDVAFVPRGDLLDRVRMALVDTALRRRGARPGSDLPIRSLAVRIRRHPGTYPQILAVLEGSGEVSGANGVDEPIGPGEAVLLHEGEDHEMKSEAGLTALIIEGESLDRFRARPTAPSAPE